MRVIVHPDLALSGTTLVDARLGVRYCLTQDAAWLLGQLKREPCIEKLVPAIARHQRINEAEAKQALYALLGLLEKYGGVQIAWDSSFSLLASLRIRSKWRSRYTGSFTGLVRSLIRAYGALLGVSLVIFMVGKVTLGPTFASFWVGMSVGVVATCLVHEAGHAVCAGVHKVPFIVVARLGFAGVMYPRPPTRQARWIALWGPLAAMIFCGLSGVLSTPLPLRAIWLLAGLVHACSFLPFLSDGKTIWRYK